MSSSSISMEAAKEGTRTGPPRLELDQAETLGRAQRHGGRSSEPEFPSALALCEESDFQSETPASFHADTLNEKMVSQLPGQDSTRLRGRCGALAADGSSRRHAVAGQPDVTVHSGECESWRSSTPARRADGASDGTVDGCAPNTAQDSMLGRPLAALEDDSVPAAAISAAPVSGHCKGDISHRPPAARRWLHMDDGTEAVLSGEDFKLESAAKELQSSILSFLADAESAPACQTPLRFGAGSSLPTPVRAPTVGFLTDRSTVSTAAGAEKYLIQPWPLMPGLQIAARYAAFCSRCFLQLSRARAEHARDCDNQQLWPKQSCASSQAAPSLGFLGYRL